VPLARLAVAAAVLAVGLSWWTVGRAMLGQPLSIDSAEYVLQARALTHGHFGVAPPHPV
jgi:hypothetical protein